MSLFAELKRRNVIRMAGLYLVGAWLVTQVAGTVLPMFGAPEWLARSVVLLLAIGFIPVMVFAWAFELTPDGIKRDADVAPSDSIAPQTARRMNRMIVAVLVLAVTFFAFDRLVLAPRRDAALVVATTQSVKAAAATAATPVVDPRSIAVLPFVNMSEDMGNDFFSDGISEEILNVLVSVKGLKVTSRTSAFQFRSQQGLGVPAIASALKVRHVLEGSVRKSGDRIRITAQLIDASRDAHLWSETFDRTLTTGNLFEIQDEIAQAIVAAINRNLGAQVGTADSVPQRTGNLDAYALYLKARPSYYRRENFQQMADLLGQAVELDPSFVDALAMRASVFSLSADYGQPLGGTSQQAWDTAEALVQQALALDPGHGLAIGVRTTLRDLERGRTKDTELFATGLQNYAKALQRDPNSLDLLNWRGRQLAWAGRFEAAESDFRRCSQIEPLYGPCRVNLAMMMLLQGRKLEASEEYTAAAAKGAVSGSTVSLFLFRALDRREAFYMQGNALALLRGFYAFDELYDALGQPLADHAVLRSRLTALEESGNTADEMALLLVALGDHRKRVFSYVTWLPMFDEYRRSAGFKAVMIESGLLAYWQAEGFPPHCRALGSNDFTCDKASP
jgi:TolB-like protein/Tfp pilus assembly protein PilF